METDFLCLFPVSSVLLEVSEIALIVVNILSSQTLITLQVPTLARSCQETSNQAVAVAEQVNILLDILEGRAGPWGDISSQQGKVGRPYHHHPSHFVTRIKKIEKCQWTLEHKTGRSKSQVMTSLAFLCQNASPVLGARTVYIVGELSDVFNKFLFSNYSYKISLNCIDINISHILYCCDLYNIKSLILLLINIYE